jgi:anthraniloyl-CoA monooxygenase
MAMEDAVTLAERVASVAHGDEDLASALSAYEAERAESVGKIQDAARPSLSWWERFGFYQRELDPLTFAFHFFSRSIGVARIAERDPSLVQQVRAAWQATHGASPLLTTINGDDHTGSQTPRFLHSLPHGMPRVDAPAREHALAEKARELPEQGELLIVGRHELSKVLLSEDARLGRGLTTFLAGDYDEDAAETLLLSGRCDGVVTIPSTETVETP